MDQPLPIRRRQRLSCLLITILGLLLSCSTSSCQQTDFSTTLRYTKTIDSRTPTTDSVTETTTNRLYKYNSSLNKLTENSTEPNYLIDKYLKNQGMFWDSGVSFVKLLSLVNRECLMKSSSSLECAKKMVVKYMQDILYSPDSYKSEDSNNEVNPNESLSVNNFKKEKNVTALQELVLRRLSDFRVNVNLLQIKDRVKESARAGLSWFKPEGKSSFLTGFGLGFLAFGLKKLLLPIFIGAQIVKSVLIAMFLPSILGGLGKLVGKGVTTFASASGSSGPSNNNVDDFEFKDNVGVDPADPSTAESKYSYMFQYPESGGYGYQNGLPAGTLPAAALYVPGTAAGAASNRYQPLANPKVSYASLPTGAQHHYGSYYTRHQQTNKKQDYKVFHNIPSSSLLLTNYDPFYSPLLSRLDSVFKQLGYESENCRERLVCAMYNNPAKFAPYSNLVSAQLSRELNELRKPSTDNPEILRFFRYMKAAKDGQDGQDCIRTYPGCIASSGTSNANPPMVKTYQDINKLVQARRLSRSMTIEDKRPSSIHSSTT